MSRSIGHRRACHNRLGRAFTYRFRTNLKVKVLDSVKSAAPDGNRTRDLNLRGRHAPSNEVPGPTGIWHSIIQQGPLEAINSCTVVWLTLLPDTTYNASTWISPYGRFLLLCSHRPMWSNGRLTRPLSG